MWGASRADACLVWALPGARRAVANDWVRHLLGTIGHCALYTALRTVYALVIEALEVSHQTWGLSYVSTSKYAPQY